MLERSRARGLHSIAWSTAGCRDGFRRSDASSDTPVRDSGCGLGFIHDESCGRFIDSIRGFELERPGHVTVYVQCDRDRAVTQSLLDDFGVGARRQQHGRRSVTQIAEPDALEPCPIEKGLPKRGQVTQIRPKIVSAISLSYESPTLPTDSSMPASASLSVYRILRY
jgi:hypothetical protein